MLYALMDVSFLASMSWESAIQVFAILIKETTYLYRALSSDIVAGLHHISSCKQQSCSSCPDSVAHKRAAQENDARSLMSPRRRKTVYLHRKVYKTAVDNACFILTCSSCIRPSCQPPCVCPQSIKFWHSAKYTTRAVVLCVPTDKAEYQVLALCKISY